MHKPKPYTHTTYAHMHICNPPPKRGKIKCCHPANSEYYLSLDSRFDPATNAATWRISCNTYADALNSIEFCIVRVFLGHFVRHLGICNPICHSKQFKRKTASLSQTVFLRSTNAAYTHTDTHTQIHTQR